MEKVLVTGGAGYIGSVLVKLLLRDNYKVKVMDKLMFGGESIVELLNNDNFEFFKGDVLVQEDLEKAVIGVDYVVHLASIVGDPACAKEPELARKTNLESTKALYDIANKEGVKRFIFASTCSNYGKMEDPESFITETSDLRPISVYAETKVAAEEFLLSQPKENTTIPICLRFATVYGLSPRIRFDLTVNEFTKELALERELVIFGEQFWRPYCHVEDLSRSVIFSLKSDKEKVAFEVFNVGDTDENYQKQMLVEEIKKQLPDAKIKYVHKDEDPRDYRVNFDKITNELGFKITKTVPQGITHIIKVIKEGFINDPDDIKYRNS